MIGESMGRRRRPPALRLTALALLALVAQACEASPMSETLLRAYANSRGTSPGAKKLLNIPDDSDSVPGKHLPVEGYGEELERDHALPTSMPNADILKTNSNPTYHKHRLPSHHGGSALAPGGVPPSYSPPSRSAFTPPLPAGYNNPFADKPTLRGTNAENNNFQNRRPIPPPSLVPNHSMIPIRAGQDPPVQVPSPPMPGGADPHQKKKALNTPSQKVNPDVDQGGVLSVDDPRIHGPEQANYTDYVNAPLHIPTISRILSGSNGKKEEIPDVILRTVTAKPSPQNVDPPRYDSVPRNKTLQTIAAGTRLTLKGNEDDVDVSTEGSALPVMDPDNLDRPLLIDTNGESNTRRNLQFATNKNAESSDSADGNAIEVGGGTKLNQNGATLTTYVEQSTEKLHNSHNAKEHHHQPQDGKIHGKPSKTGGVPISYRNQTGITWPIAWNLHIYLATVMFTVLAVYSIFKIICYNKFTHLFTQYYFIILHLILVLVCLMRIFYMCYDPYNISRSLPVFLSEILLHVPEIFLSVAFAATILFLLINSINFKSGCYAFIARPRTVICGGFVHTLFCIILHTVENVNPAYKEFDGFEKRALGLICQAVYIAAALILSIVYFYVYKTVKKVLRKKSHSYIQGFQNLYQAIHINLATAMLFILLASLQIYGIFGINIQVNMTKFDWLQWGYQFSLRLIEISIVILISWVIGLKVGIGSGLQSEKSDNHNKISGLGLFPCTAGSSNEQFETDYPAICTTNTNLHTYTLRTGKPIYDAGVLGGAGHLQMPPDHYCPPSGPEGPRYPISSLANACDSNSMVDNYSGRSSIANAAHSSSTESSNAASAQSASNHLMKHGGGYLVDNLSASDEHYSNCDQALHQNMDSAVLDGEDLIDHEYNVIQYGNSSDFIRDKNPYGAGSARNSQNNFKHLSFDRLSSRNNSGHNLSNPRKKHRKANQKGGHHQQQPNCMTLGNAAYDVGVRHYHHPHMSNDSGGEFGYPSDNGSFHASGIQTLNPVRNNYYYGGQGRDSQRRPRNDSPSALNSSGSQKRGRKVPPPQDQQQRPKSTDLYGFAENPGNPEQITETDDRGNNSMLVAQDGFVRFRPLEDGQT